MPKVEALRRWCAEEGRDPTEIEWGLGVEPEDLDRFLREDADRYLELGFTQFTLGFNGPGLDGRPGRRLAGLAGRAEPVTSWRGPRLTSARMSEPHPLVSQLRFTRAEFQRGRARRVGGRRPRPARPDELHRLERRPPRLAGAALLPDPRARGRRRTRTSRSGSPTARRAARRSSRRCWRPGGRSRREADPWLDALTSARLLEHPDESRPPDRRHVRQPAPAD